MKNIVKFIIESIKSKKEKETVKEGISILDSIQNKSEEEVKNFVQEFIRPNGPTIYAFITDKVKDAIKVGYTDQHPEKRIAQWKDIYGKNAGEVTCLGWWSAEEFNQAGERVFFWDHAVHKKISNKGYKQLKKDEFMSTLTDKGKEIIDIHFSSEFFRKLHDDVISGKVSPEEREELSEKIVENILIEMKKNIKEGTADFKLYSFDEQGKTSNKQADKVWKSPDTYSNTELQEEAIKNGIKAIKNGKKNILMAAVMRFGKTHASYEIIKQAGLKRVIVCSAKADVRTAWREDINHEHFYKDFIFIEVLGPHNWDVTYCKGNKLVTEHGIPNMEALEKSGKTIIYFFTLHDLAGSLDEIKEKHKNIFDKEFDIMVVDETHYGSHANSFGKATGLGHKDIEDDDNKDVEEEQKIAKEVEDGLKKLNIKYKTILQVSGTPYYILASNEMIQDNAEIISKVSYTDMLNARDKWDKEHKNEDPSKSPYFGIPTLHKIGLRLSQKCRKILGDKGYTDSMTELFKVKGGKFAYENAIEELMKSIFGDGKNNSLSFLKNKSVDGNKVCKHTLVVLPRIEAAQKLKELLNNIIDTSERQILCIVGNSDVKNVDELNSKLKEFDNKGKKSIILTVNRFLTGVSMPLVDSMIYLKNASSPQEYDQNIFRLCTRNVKTVKDPDNESRSKKVNMKDNVYLIDFNISNMFNMIANSAKMKAAAEGNPTTKRIKELMKEDLGATPIFCEDKGSNEILGKMHKISSKDLMEIYTGYNKNKSIADIINDELNLFSELFKKKEFQDVIEDIDIEGDKSKLDLEINDKNGEDIDFDDIDKKMKSLKDTTKDNVKNIKDKLNKEQITKEKFKAITKNLLYCNICLDEPCKDVDEIIDKANDDNEFKKMLNEFKISVTELGKIYNIMSTSFKQAYNTLLMRMSILAQDSSKDGYEKFSQALKGLGRLGKSEVVTPTEIVEKMINKLDKSEYEKAKSILLVNEKQGEFLYGLTKKFGKDIAKKCKIIFSSEIGKHLCIKMLKSIGLDNYINKIIVPIKDEDGNGKIDIKDFLKMSNEDILKENNGKKFDIVLMNPPYDRSLHLKFLEKTIQIADNVVSIQPIRWLEEATAKFNKKSAQNKYEESISKHINDLEIITAEEAKKYFGILLPANCGIYVCNEKGGFDYKKLSANEVVDKVIEYIQNNKCNFEMNKKDGYRLRVPFISGGKAVGSGERPPLLTELPIKDIVFKDGKHNGKWWYEYYTKNQYSKTTEEITSSIQFNSEEEAHNFYKSIKTDFARYIENEIITDVNISNTKILWMGNAKHPRTGNIGYKDAWTNEDFYKFFNINKEQQKMIEDFIKNYEEKYNNWMKIHKKK